MLFRSRHHGQPRRLRFQHRNAEAFKPGGEDKDIHPLHQGGNVIPAALVQGMDVFVFPSRFEGFGIAMLEAQSSRKTGGSESIRQERFFSGLFLKP